MLSSTTLVKLYPRPLAHFSFLFSTYHYLTYYIFHLLLLFTVDFPH